MRIASYPPNNPRPSPHNAARHINEEARLVLTSLRGGPPYVARGELALGLRELRSFVRNRFLDGNVSSGGGGGVGGGGGLGGGGGEYYSASHSNLGAPTGAGSSSAKGQQQQQQNNEDDESNEAKVGNDHADAPASPRPQIRIPPPLSPRRGGEMVDSASTSSSSGLPPPPMIDSDQPSSIDNNASSATSTAAPANAPADNDDGSANTDELKESTIPPEQCPTTPPVSPIQVSPPTPHSVPPSSPMLDAAEGTAATESSSSGAMPPLPLAPELSNTQSQQQSTGGIYPPQQPHQQQQHQQSDPGPYATPFLSVIVDPRAAGPHTLVALRALHRLLERGSIVQVTRCGGSGGSGNGNRNSTRGSIGSVASVEKRDGVASNNAPQPGGGASGAGGEQYAFETTLEPIVRGVLACRFEQTDAGADEAVEMAIADLLRLLVELDAAGARAAESVLLRQVYLKRQSLLAMQQQQGGQQQQRGGQKVVEEGASGSSEAKPSQKTTPNNSTTNNSKQGTLIKIQRLPSSILMESFHAVYITRRTFVLDKGGHHSPALSFHFECVLLKMVHCIFGGDDATSALRHGGGSSSGSGSAAGGKGGGRGGGGRRGRMISSRHVGAAKKVLEFLIDSLAMRRRKKSFSAPGSGSGNDDGWSNMIDGTTDDSRTLCVRLIQCCLRTGWGWNSDGANNNGSSLTTTQSTTSDGEDGALLRLVEDDLCFALLSAGQAIWSHHDEMPSFNASAATSSSGGGASDMLGSSNTSMELLSEVCATLSLLWSLPNLRYRLRSQFESIFCGFYQRALSLLRKRPVPRDGTAYQANVLFDTEVEVILESLVDVLCLSSPSGGGCGGDGSSTSLSTIEELFLTYDCSTTGMDVASGLLVELCRCCGGMVDEEGEPYLPSMPPSRADSSVSVGSSEQSRGTSSPLVINRYRTVPDHLKELCFEALLGSLRRLFHGVGNMTPPAEDKGPSGDDGVQASSASTPSSLRSAKNKKRSLHHAARLFNDKPKKGLQYLAENGMLPNPPDARSVASFLRNGLVVGLDKAAVGQYLGELGKSARDATESTTVFERDWFHGELLTEFCSSFAFEHQTVLDGLRMFLATFRLPGEAQMIDRILQAFAEGISRECEESVAGPLKLFSPDEKRASDAAYLLSFSIIMLNTDLHNENIRADRKMKLSDFIRNNKNYGKDISDRDLPNDYLEGIYRNIKEEQIRTLGEGADGSMTVERWKDVMRSASSYRHSNERRAVQSGSDVKDLKELLLECSWHPILSAVSGLWGMVPDHADVPATLDQNGTTGARLGIDLAYEVLSGASNLSRPDIFQDLFTNICYMSGLLGEYKNTTEERTENFISSIEHQSAFTVIINITEENGDIIGLDGWRCVWAMLFELRDLQLLPTKQPGGIMQESDPDFLSPEARLEFCQRMVYGDIQEDGQQARKGMSLMSFVFGSSGSLHGGKTTPAKTKQRARPPHGKEDHLIWDELAPSDEEDENNSSEYLSFPHESPRKISSIGSAFENQLMYETALDSEEIGVTGLERIDTSHTNQKSHRARVRNRLSRLVDLHGLITETRYLSEEGLSDALNSLVEIIRDSSRKTSPHYAGEAVVGFPLSPASEAFAEILLIEIALKNRDRFALVWNTILRAHYNSRLTYRPSRGGDGEEHQPLLLTQGIEKCVTAIMRLCVWTSTRNTAIQSEVLSTLKILYPPCGLMLWSPLELNLDKHLSEGLWRIVRNVDGLAHIDDEGWSGILGLVEFCATRGGIQSNDDIAGSLDEDDPSLQAFRSLHLILHAAELKDSLPVDIRIVRSVRCLVEAGERGNCPKLSIAGLDLLQVLHSRMEMIAAAKDGESQLIWLPILEAISEPAEKSRNASVRQQAISLLTDALLSNIQQSGQCDMMINICIPLAGKRITDLLRIPYDVQSDLEETLIELELCISLLFKPFLHHLKTLISVKQEFVGIWLSMLGIMTQLLGDESAAPSKEDDTHTAEDDVVTRAKLFNTTKELASEHLRNAVMVLAAMGVLDGDSAKSDTQEKEITSVTWAAIGSIGYCKPHLDEWKTACCQ